jgi:hypothetical protein
MLRQGTRLARKIRLVAESRDRLDARIFRGRIGDRLPHRLEVLLAASEPAQQADEMIFQRLLPDIGLGHFPR